jgi:hypothetical protein
MKTETEPAHDLSFPKIPSVWIRAMRQNQRITRRDAYVLQLLDPTIMREMSVNNRRGPCGS